MCPPRLGRITLYIFNYLLCANQPDTYFFPLPVSYELDTQTFGID